MATTQWAYRGAASTSSATLRTVSSTSAVATVTNIVLANAATSASTATVALDGVVIIPAVSIPANSVVGFDMKQVLEAANPAKTITGFASTTNVTIHISGVEVA